MLAKRSVLVGVLVVAASGTSRAQAVRADTASNVSSYRNGSWSARTSSGRPLMGTWTAVLDTAGTVTGTWTLIDAKGNTMVEGAWSAAKSLDRWTGAWRAVVAGRQGEFSGTWTANINDKSSTRFSDLFEQALRAVVSGNWRMAQHSGAWSVRTFK